MNTSFERVKNSTDEWYTPNHIVEALGIFDLDPCAAPRSIRPYPTAKIMYDKDDDGLTKEWHGRVWLNPPYSRPLIERFLVKMIVHGNGIALLFNRLDRRLFQTFAHNADAVMILQGRVKFLDVTGKERGTPGCGSILVAFGRENVVALKESGLKGIMLTNIFRV